MYLFTKEQSEPRLMVGSRLLVIDDDVDLSAIVARYLESEGFVVECTVTAADAYAALTVQAFDLVLLDINLPDDDGFAVCRELRRVSGVPIIFASARTSETDRIEGFDTGGDDYLPKPYSLRELLAHVRALLRRVSSVKAGSSSEPFFVGPFALNEAAVSLTKSGKTVSLSPREFDLACRLMKSPGVVLSKKQLVAEVWGAFSEVEQQTVSVHMNWLRAKLEDDPSHPVYFKTVRGKGYLFDATGAATP